ncbi:SMP-30/gluconolactonase/LRE family protein [uncultured Aquimarina sp.]|uniref:SMP-30/gluconolactonase/LRE family protein n=1 Tax=uncultured Aquimarina sp. TaxID=575652 RepID=UPI00261FCA9A|nr:SMP-30/gluconolactonase/LRE family protein [uncultured Aquimarina sp.]
MSLIGCSDQKTEYIELDFENDLIPEGIAIDSRTKKVYLNSLKNNKIVFSDLDGDNPSTFLKSKEHGYLSGFGMTIKGDTLYALSNKLTGQSNTSVLLLLQLSTKTLIDSYTITDNDFRYLNDLTISTKNEIFITDSESNKVYKIKRPSKKIEIYLDSEEIANSNGITISSNDKYLYLASTKGIRIVEIDTKKVLNEVNKEFLGIDGLKFYNNNLYGIVNVHSRDTSKNGLFKYNLNNNGTGILESKKIVEFRENFNIPTTLDICDGYIYFVINTQLDNFDGNTNKVLDLKKLESYKLMKIKAQ